MFSAYIRCCPLFLSAHEVFVLKKNIVDGAAGHNPGEMEETKFLARTQGRNFGDTPRLSVCRVSFKGANPHSLWRAWGQPRACPTVAHTRGHGHVSEFHWARRSWTITVVRERSVRVKGQPTTHPGHAVGEDLLGGQRLSGRKGGSVPRTGTERTREPFFCGGIPAVLFLNRSPRMTRRSWVAYTVVPGKYWQQAHKAARCGVRVTYNTDCPVGYVFLFTSLSCLVQVSCLGLCFSLTGLLMGSCPGSLSMFQSGGRQHPFIWFSPRVSKSGQQKYSVDECAPSSVRNSTAA